ncbi:MAG: AzlD domain-containing protein [Spirochaetales bacterium]|jgi:branched-subunit amino acid transport protein AzlD|nr:AzlD domain-containing protein [Spirochaetales bacterium]
MTSLQAVILIALMSVCTFLTRALPFILFPAARKIPPFVVWLGNALPFAIIAMLVVYCLKDVSLKASPHGLPELISIAAVVLLYLWKRSPLLAIAGGTVLHMFLAQAVF